jgi:NTP pyrophosphatase (non-canonical NTP hydrolase)
MPFTSRDLESIRAEVQQFADEREWEQFHSPRNLLLAVMSELGEAADLVRWAGDQEPAISPEIKQAWDDEIADVFTLLVRLADRSGVDLTAAFARKLAQARLKYPVDEFKGSKRKYDQARSD